MKKGLTCIITFFLIVSLTLSFCCCLSEVFAQPSQQSEHCHHDTGKTDQNHSEGSHDCRCQKIVNSDLNKPFNVDLTLYHFYKDFLKGGMIPVYFLDYPLANQISLLSDHSPPSLLAASIPIYLKISILRI